jgi:hypothetical protein
MPRKSDPNSEVLKGLNSISKYIHITQGETAKLLQDGIIPGRFINGSWRVRKECLNNWLDSGNQQVGA